MTKIGDKITCILGAWCGPFENGWTELLKEGNEYEVIGFKSSFVIVKAETGESTEVSSKLYFGLVIEG